MPITNERRKESRRQITIEVILFVKALPNLHVKI